MLPVPVSGGRNETGDFAGWKVTRHLSQPRPRGEHMTTRRPTKPPTERVMAKIHITDDGCWEFIGARTTAGYGKVKVDGKLVTTHRLMLKHHLGAPIPDGLEIDHICRNKPCCNPAHLELVTHQENCRRGWVGRLSGKCRNGHVYDEINTRMTPDGYRECRKCNSESTRRYKARLRGEAS